MSNTTPSWRSPFPLPVALRSWGSLGPSLQDYTMQKCIDPCRKVPFPHPSNMSAQTVMLIPAWAQVSLQTEVLEFCFSSFWDAICLSTQRRDVEHMVWESA